MQYFIAPLTSLDFYTLLLNSMIRLTPCCLISSKKWRPCSFIFHENTCIVRSSKVWVAWNWWYVMVLNHYKFEYQSSAFLLLLVPLNHASLLTDFFQFKSWILPFNCYAKLQNTRKGNPKHMVCCLKDF